MIVYGALARAEALLDKRDEWWAVEAYDTESKIVVRLNPVYKERFNAPEKKSIEEDR